MIVLFESAHDRVPFQNPDSIVKSFQSDWEFNPPFSSEKMRDVKSREDAKRSPHSAVARRNRFNSTLQRAQKNGP